MAPRAAAPELPAELAALAVDAALGAGRLARDMRQQGLAVDTKSSSTDLVTQVDRATERWLVDRLHARRPDDAILGEEGGERPGTSGVRWVVDPIDGTVNFVLGIPQYAVSVAAEVDGIAVAGCVFNPESGEVFHAIRGRGAFLDGRPIRGPRRVPLERAVVGTGFGYDRGRRARQAAVTARLLPRVADIRRLGAASLDLAALAAGRLDAYYEVGLSAWDWAAGALLAEEAGCVVRAGTAGLTAAAGPDLADDFFALLAELDAGNV